MHCILLYALYLFQHERLSRIFPFWHLPRSQCINNCAKPKHHYENTPIQIYRPISPPKTENFSDKNSDIFHISAKSIDCGYSLEPLRLSGSNKYPQSMFLSRNKNNNEYPCKPSPVLVPGLE